MEKNTTKKKIIIIGGGISGITSGIYGQLNDFDTEIFERNAQPGGLCTSWIRKDFPIDGCIHWMTGTRKGTAIYNMWQDTGAFSDEDIIREDNFGSVDVDGKVVTFWKDVNKLEKEFLSIAPEDEKQIKKFCKLIYTFQNMPLPIDIPVNTMKFLDFLKIGFNMIPYIFPYLKASKTSIKNYIKKFKNPTLKKSILKIIGDRYSIYSLLYVYGTTAIGSGGVPKGGSSALINNMVERYKNLGGKLHTCSDVNSIILKGNKAVGIELKNGSKIYGDYVIAACDPFHTKTLLKIPCDFNAFEKRSIKSNKYPLPSAVLVSLTVDKDVKDALNLTSSFEFYCEKFKVGNSVLDSLKIRDYSYDDHFIKNGKVLLSVLLPQFDADYSYWQSFDNREDYMNAKYDLANKISDIIISRFPTLKNHLEIIDVATPKTFNRYTHAFRGAYMPFALTAENNMMLHNGRVPGIKNLYLSSQWQIMPGGLPVALMTGKFAIQKILKKENRFYRITKPVKLSFNR